MVSRFLVRCLLGALGGGLVGLGGAALLAGLGQVLGDEGRMQSLARAALFAGPLSGALTALCRAVDAWLTEPEGEEEPLLRWPLTPSRNTPLHQGGVWLGRLFRADS